MPSNGDQTTDTSMERIKRGFGSYVSRSVVTYENCGGGRGDSSSFRNNGIDFEDDCESWSQDGLSITGVNGSSSSGSSEEDCYSDDGDKSSTTRSGSSSSEDSDSDSGESGQKGKWLLSLRTVIDRMVSNERKGRGKKRVVETNIRPSTTFKYFIGMSGFPSTRKPT